MTSSAPETQNCSTEGWLWLTLGPDQWNIQQEKFFFQVYVSRKWLVDRLVSNSPDSRVANIVIEKTDLRFWYRYITLFGRRFWLDLPWFVLPDDVEDDLLETGVACVVHLDKDPCLGSVDHVRGKIVSGGVSVRSRNGFDDKNNPFWDSPDSGSPSSAAIQLCRRLWPGGTPGEGTEEAIAAFIFGASSFQMEILDRLDHTDKNRRRLQLCSSENGVRIWETVPCPQAQAVLSPTEVVTKRLEDLSEALNEKDPKTKPLMKVQLDQRTREGSIEPTVFYRIEFAAHPPAPKKLELIRPVVRLLFPGHSGPVSWVPGSLKVSRDPQNHAIYEFSEEQSDELLKKMAPGSGGGVAAWEVEVEWKHDAPGVKPVLQILTIPSLYAKGRTPIERDQAGLPPESPDSEYVWHLAALEPNPAPSQPLPRVWVRYHIPDQIPADGKSGPPEKRLEGLSGGILLPHDLDPRGWSLGFDIPAKNGASTASIRGTFTVDSARKTVLVIKLQVSPCHVTAYSPLMTVYKDRLVDAAALPNAKNVDETLGQASLVFSNDRPKTSESSTEQVISAGFDSTSGMFELQGSDGAAVAYVPYHRPGSGAVYQAALIDFASPSRGNLVQQLDPISGRTIIPRDVNHGLLPWTIKRWRFQPLEGEQFTVALAFEDDGRGRESKDAVMALAPWVQWMDPAYKPDTAVRILHHRNLVLEHGEVEASAEDRKVGGKPSTLPANAEDFVQAVRDPYTVAAAKLKETPPAGETTDDAQLVNWLPGAYVLDTAGQAWPGKVWLQLPSEGEGMRRLPAVRCSKIEGEAQDPSLSILWCESNQPGEPQGTRNWLTYDVKWEQVLPPETRPTFVLRHAAELPPGDGFRLRNSSAPLLFDGAAVTAVCGPSQAVSSLAATGGRDGLVRLWDVPTGHLLARYRCYPDSGVNGEAPVVQAVSLCSSSGQLYLAAVTDKGSLRIWNYTQNSAPTEHQLATAVKCAALQQLGTMLYLVVANASAEVHLFRWDPASPANLTEILFPAGQPSGERVTATSAGSDLYVAAFGATIPVTVHQVRGALVSAIDIVKPPQQARACSLLYSQKLWLAVAGINRSLEAFSMGSGQLVICDMAGDGTDKFAPREWGDLAGVCLGELPTEGRTPVKLFASWSDGAIRRWEVKGTQEKPGEPRPPELAYTGHYGAVQAMACCGMAVSPYVNRWRPQLFSAGMEGTARIWDMVAAYERGRFLHDERVYDNLGTIRSTTWTAAQSDWIIEEINYPNCTDAPRPAVSYRPPGSVIAVSYPAPKSGSSFQALVEEKDGNQVITQICFACEGLKLVKQTDGTWKPEQFADDFFKECPSSDQFPFHRGHQGVYGFSSTAVNVHPFTLGWPLLGGVPVYPVRLDSIRFDNNGNATEISFCAAVVNPLEVIGEEKEDEIPGLVREAVARWALIQVALSKSTTGFSVTKVGGTINWDFPLGLQEQSSFPFTGFSGKLARVTGNVSYEEVTKSAPKRLVLTLGENSGSAVALG
jgi:WD40 repeat protein